MRLHYLSRACVILLILEKPATRRRRDRFGKELCVIVLALEAPRGARAQSWELGMIFHNVGKNFSRDPKYKVPKATKSAFQSDCANGTKQLRGRGNRCGISALGSGGCAAGRG